MKGAVYGLVNGVVSIALFLFLNSVDVFTFSSRTTPFSVTIFSALLLSLINTKIMNKMTPKQCFEFSLYSMTCFIIGYLPAMVFVVLFVEVIVSLFIDTTMIIEEPRSNFLMIVIYMNYGLGLLISLLLSYRFKMSRRIKD